MTVLELPTDEGAELDAIAFLFDADRPKFLAQLSAEDFTGYFRPTIFRAVERLHARGEPISDFAVADEAGEDRARVLQARLEGSPLFVVETLRRVIEASARRRVMIALDSLGRTLADPENDFEEAIERCRAVMNYPVPLRALRVPEYDAWADGVSMDYDWLIPGVLEGADRAILVAEEGRGKSVMLRQWAIQAAAGIHPFTETRIRPLRCLIVDAENSERQIVRQTAPMRTLAERDGSWSGHRFGILATPTLDLHDREDRTTIEAYLESFRPEILVIGPIYKIFSRGRKDFDTAAETATAILDGWRKRFGCAMLIEHHAPKGQAGKRELDPFGSSVLVRWPEFGLTLRPDKDDRRVWVLGRFRGDRELGRGWPARLMQGGAGAWPWRLLPEDRDPNF